MAVSHKICCFRCQKQWSYEPPLSRRSECPGCSRDAKVCLNCRFYDKGAHRECREDQAEWVKDKEKGNFCGFFEPNQISSPTNAKDQAQSKLDALFGDAPAQKKSEGGSFADDLQKFINSKK